MKSDLPKCALVPKKMIERTLASPPAPGKKLLEPLLSFAAAHNLPFNILEDHEVTENDAEVHTQTGDLWHCLEGEVIFVYGGTLTHARTGKKADGTSDRRELKGKKINNGTRTILKQGDWLWIPSGQPHQHLCAKTARLIIIKIPLGKN
ncbi:MAG: hypothetical protein HYS15_02105 [Candidatus Spechtbacteria bacterium]|nr:hypothetical protein [Candidatus Spechtbacteria bacterium]